MNVRKVVAGSVLAAGLGVAGLIGAGAASADVTNNGTTNDATGYGLANYNNLAHNADDSLGTVGSLRSAQTVPGEISQSVGVNTPTPITVDTQGKYAPISNKDGNKFGPTTFAH